MKFVIIFSICFAFLTENATPQQNAAAPIELALNVNTGDQAKQQRGGIFSVTVRNLSSKSVPYYDGSYDVRIWDALGKNISKRRRGFREGEITSEGTLNTKMVIPPKGSILVRVFWKPETGFTMSGAYTGQVCQMEFGPNPVCSPVVSFDVAP